MNVYDTLLALTGACSGTLSIYLYRKYRHWQQAAYSIQRAETIELNNGLEDKIRAAEDHRIAFAVVLGKVQGVGRTLSSRTRNGLGVIRQTQLSEHRSTKTHGIWTNVTKILYDTLDSVPFALSNPASGYQIMVTEAIEAENILKELDVTHSNFIPYTISSLRGEDWVFGEVFRGVQETEKMLHVGTHLMGIGELVIENGHIRLQPPEEDLVYILTKQTKSQVIRQYLYQATTFKLSCYVMSALTVIFLGFALWRVIHGCLQRFRMTRGFEKIRRLALTARRSMIRAEDLRQNEICVICLVNVREVVTLECGHIAMCSSCVQWLTYPHRCPVCRQHIERFLPVEFEFPV